MGLTSEPRKPDFSFSFTYTSSNLINTIYNIDWFSYPSKVWIQNLNRATFSDRLRGKYIQIVSVHLTIKAKNGLESDTDQS